jgi:hypothetical protein
MSEKSGGRPVYRWEDRVKNVLKPYGVKIWTGFIWRRIESNCGFCEHSSEFLCSLKFREFLTNRMTTNYSSGTLLCAVNQHAGFTNVYLAVYVL